ncbi:MAG: DUF167 domain-containing protein [Nanoarchaeota archaeon]
MIIKSTIFKIIVKPNASKNQIIGYDTNKDAYRISIKAKAEKNKANIEVIKFLSKQLGKKVIILRGKQSREKIIKIDQKG